MSDDPTRMRNQPALVTSTGRSWLVIGALFTAIAVAVLVPMTQLPPPGIAVAAIVADLALYAGMVVARLVAPHGRVRLGIMAAALIGSATVSLGCVLVVAASSAG